LIEVWQKSRFGSDFEGFVSTEIVAQRVKVMKRFSE